MPNPDIGIVIVTWNGRTLLTQCLRTVFKQSIVDRLCVVVVDNGSTDGTAEWLREHYPNVTIIPLSSNTGFAAANNLGITTLLRKQHVDYILTLNNDMELTPRFVEELIHTCERHPRAGVIQGRLYRKFQPDQLDCVGMLVAPDMSAMNRGQYITARGAFEQEEEVFGASASAALYTRTALRAVRLSDGVYFDPYYFAYYEDVQLAWRLRLADFQAWYTPLAIAYHAHSATGVSHSPFKAYYIHRNQYANIITLLPFSLLVLSLLLMPVRYLLLFTSIVYRRGATAQLAKHSQQESLIHIVLRGWKDLLTHLPLLVEHRHAILQTRIVSVFTILGWYRHYCARIRTMIYGQE